VATRALTTANQIVTAIKRRARTTRYALKIAAATRTIDAMEISSV
jgi:hypothetical protein